MKFRATTTKPFGAGAKKTPAGLKKTSQTREEIEKAAKEVFGDAVDVNRKSGINIF